MESVVNQTYENLEILAVDDGTKDSSGEILDAWAKKDSRIRVFHRENHGLSASRNFAAKEAKGEYITFVDSDDWLTRDCIAYLFELLTVNDADFSVGGYFRPTSLEEAKESFDYEEEVLSRKEFLSRFFKINTQVNVQYAWAKLYKKALVLNNPYPEGMIDEDVPTIFSIACDSIRIAMSSKIVYQYFVNETSITESNFSAKKFDLLKAWDIVVETAEKKNQDEWTRENARLNRDRADFGILVNLAQSANYKRDKVTFAAEKKAALARLRKNYRELLRGPIPKSRKVFILGFVISYPVTAWFINTVSNRNRR
jgi:glycosyltransferase involved in cell wall biosynthesis